MNSFSLPSVVQKRSSGNSSTSPIHLLSVPTVDKLRSCSHCAKKFRIKDIYDEYCSKDCSTCHQWFIRPSANSGIPIPVRQPMKINRPPPVTVVPVTTNNNVIVSNPSPNAKMPKFWSTSSPAISMKSVPNHKHDGLNELVIASLDHPNEDIPVSSSPVVIDSFSTGTSAIVQRMPSIEENILNPAKESSILPSLRSNPNPPSILTPSPPKGCSRNPSRPASRKFASISFEGSPEQLRTIRQQFTDDNDMAAVHSPTDPQETSSAKHTWKNAHSVEFEVQVQHPASVTGYPVKPSTTKHTSPRKPSESKRLSSIPTFRVTGKSSKAFDAADVPDVMDMTTNKGRTSFMLDTMAKAIDWFFPTKSNRLLLQQ